MPLEGVGREARLERNGLELLVERGIGQVGLEWAVEWHPGEWIALVQRLLQRMMSLHGHLGMRRYQRSQHEMGRRERIPSVPRADQGMDELLIDVGMSVQESSLEEECGSGH